MAEDKEKEPYTNKDDGIGDSLEEEEEPLTPDDLDERRDFMEEVFTDLSVILHKEVEISSTSYPGHTRSYHVEDLEKVYVPGKRGFIAAIRLINKSTPEIYQPTLRYPSEPVKIRKEKGDTIYTLTYSHDPNVVQSFRTIYKKSRSDENIYLRFIGD